MRARIVLTTTMAVFAALPAVAAAKPTAVTAIHGEMEEIPFTLVAGVQRLDADHLGLTAFRVDDAPGIGRYAMVLASGGCSSKLPPRASLLHKALTDNEAIVRKRFPVSAAAVQDGLAVFIVDPADREVEACGKVSRFAANGQIVSPRDSASGQATGIVAVRKTGRKARVTQLLGGLGDTATHEIGGRKQPCGQSSSFTATDDLWQFKRVITGSFMDYTDDAAMYDSIRSLAVVKRGVTGAESCGIWNFHVWSEA